MTATEAMPPITRRVVLAGLALLPVITPRKLPAETAERAVIFVGASWCPVCHQAAPALYQAAQTWGWAVLVASADDQPIPPFPEFMPASTHPVARVIGAYPTTIIVDPRQDLVIDVFEGYPGLAPYLARVQDGLSGEDVS